MTNREAAEQCVDDWWEYDADGQPNSAELVNAITALLVYKDKWADDLANALETAAWKIDASHCGPRPRDCICPCKRSALDKVEAHRATRDTDMEAE